jgi:hypothetical protein
MNKISKFIKTIFMALRVFLIIKLSGKLGVLINIDVYSDNELPIGARNDEGFLNEQVLIVHNVRHLPKEFLNKDFLKI